MSAPADAGSLDVPEPSWLRQWRAASARVHDLAGRSAHHVGALSAALAKARAQHRSARSENDRLLEELGALRGTKAARRAAQLLDTVRWEPPGHGPRARPGRPRAPAPPNPIPPPNPAWPRGPASSA